MQSKFILGFVVLCSSCSSTSKISTETSNYRLTLDTNQNFSLYTYYYIKQDFFGKDTNVTKAISQYNNVHGIYHISENKIILLPFNSLYQRSFRVTFDSTGSKKKCISSKNRTLPYYLYCGDEFYKINRKFKEITTINSDTMILYKKDFEPLIIFLEKNTNKITVDEFIKGNRSSILTDKTTGIYSKDHVIIIINNKAIKFNRIYSNSSAIQVFESTQN